MGIGGEDGSPFIISHPLAQEMRESLKIGAYFGDIMKDIDTLLKQKGVKYLCKNVGGFGSVKLYIITK
jgi:hypothetical protein